VNQPLNKKRLNVVVVLDRSGSMKGSEQATVGALNRYFEQLREDVAIDPYVTLLMFDSQSIDTVFSNVHAAAARLPLEAFVPRAMTPLLDAVGDGVAALDRMTADGELAALVVLTDGHENASRRFNSRTLAELLEKRQEEKAWLVLFLGADIDAWDQAQQLGVRKDRSLDVARGRIGETSAALFASTRRYVESHDPKSGGFTEDERQQMK
jgi:Mg-chelatase subunit ChlD